MLPPLCRQPRPLLVTLLHALPATTLASYGHVLPTAAPHPSATKHPCAPPAAVLAIPRTITTASPLLSPLSLLASSDGAACNDAWATRLVEAVRVEEGAACTNHQQRRRLCVRRCFSSPRGCLQRCLTNPWALRGDALLQLTIDVDAPGAQLQGIEHCNRNVIFAHVAATLLSSAASECKLRRACCRHPQNSQAWLARRRAQPPSQLAFDPMVSDTYCASL